MNVLCNNNKLFCIGCCVGSWSGKKKMLTAISENSLSVVEKDSFFNRCVCQHIVKQGKNKNIFGCRLHPKQNNGKDLRKNYRKGNWYCDRHFQCKTNRKFMNWDYSTKRDFLRFVEDKNLDFYEYSKGVYEGTLLSEFLSKDS